MRNIQPIVHQGRLVAIIVGDLAIIEDTLADRTYRHVQAMCVYALEIALGQRPGPYDNADADAYARTAVAERRTVSFGGEFGVDVHGHDNSEADRAVEVPERTR